MVFQKGKSGNPEGRPATYRQEFLRLVDESGILKDAFDVMAESIRKRRSMDTAKWLIEQCSGKAPQPITNEEGSSLRVEMILPKTGVCKQ